MNIMEQDTDMFAQVSVSFDYIPTNRAKLALASRVGLIVVPVLPYLAVEPSYDFESSVFDPTVYAGSLLFISEQAFLGLDIGYSEEKGFVRLFVNYTER